MWNEQSDPRPDKQGDVEISKAHYWKRYVPFLHLHVLKLKSLFIWPPVPITTVEDWKSEENRPEDATKQRVEVYLNRRNNVQNNMKPVLNKERCSAPGFRKLLFSTCGRWEGKQNITQQGQQLLL